MEEVDEAKVEVEMETDFDRKYSIATPTSSIKENDDLDDFQFDFIEDYDQVPKEDRSLTYYLVWPMVKLILFLGNHTKIVKITFAVLCIIGYIIFTGFALDRNYYEALVLVILGCLSAGLLLFDWFSGRFGHKFQFLFQMRCSKILMYIAGAGILLATLGWLIYDIFFATEIKADNLIGLVGLAFYTIICIFFSKAPHKINWRPVIWGYVIQLILGIFVLRTKAGFAAFDWLADQVTLFLAFADVGALFVLGGETQDISSFAFGVLPIIIFFSMIISMLYYLGFMQYIISKLSWLVEVSCGTTGPESTACVGNIFVGMTESPLLIKPYIDDLTKSELFCVMVSGFASIAGSVLGGYIKMGISASDLITACVMSAPGALAISKLLYPEMQKSRYLGANKKEPEKLECQNVVEAASLGASQAIPLVANIAAMLIAFTAFLAWLDSAVHWAGECVGQDHWSFNLLLAYLFYPFVYVMGIPVDEVLPSAMLVGQKTAFNEFLAFSELANMISYREKGYPKCDCDGNIQWLSARAETLTTYALCGFSNLGAMGIMLGGMNGIAPKRAKTFSELVLLSLFGGIIACFSRACITSILYEPVGEFEWGNEYIDSHCTYEPDVNGHPSCAVVCDGDLRLPPSGQTCDIYNQFSGYLSLYRYSYPDTYYNNITDSL